MARPFDPVLDGSLLGDGLGFVATTYGGAAQVAAVVAAVLAGVLLVGGAALAARLTTLKTPESTDTAKGLDG